MIGTGSPLPKVPFKNSVTNPAINPIPTPSEFKKKTIALPTPNNWTMTASIAFKSKLAWRRLRSIVGALTLGWISAFGGRARKAMITN
jgi:hypothetical protein